MDFALFHDPRYGGQGITFSWIERARQIDPHGSPYAAFDRFTALWAAFNGWGMCVSLLPTDAQMINAIGNDPDVRSVFEHVMRDDRFRHRFELVAPSFPLPSYSDLIQINPHFDWRGPRDNAYWAEIHRAVAGGARVRMSPPLDPARPRWPDILRCIYKVRCNLAHGGKNADDHEATFVGVFADVLEELLTGADTSLFHLGRGY